MQSETRQSSVAMPWIISYMKDFVLEPKPYTEPALDQV